MKEITKEEFRKAWKQIDDLSYDEFLALLNLTPRDLVENPDLSKKIIDWMYEVDKEDYLKERREYRKKMKGKTKEDIFREDLIAHGLIEA